MADLIVFMELSFGRPAASTMFASDAMGANDNSSAPGGCGGFGVAAADIGPELALECWRSSFAPGKAVCKLDGTLGSKWGTRQTISPTIPFALLPSQVFSSSWAVLHQRRWDRAGHITIGEGRALFKVIQALASCASCHVHRVLSLQDNMAVAAVISKGRSSSYALNYVCRRRSASCLASQISLACPWVGTSLQPADGASRELDGPKVHRPSSSLSHQGHLHEEI